MGANSGKKLTNQWKANISETMKDREFTEEHKKNLSEAKKGKRANNSKLNYQKAQDIRDKFATGKYTKKGLAQDYQVSEPTIHDVLNGKTYTKPD